jgi:hypothetical protein
MMAPDALAMHRAIAAAINAWPDIELDRECLCYFGDNIILPLPHEEGELESLGPEFEAAWDANVDRLYEFDKPEGEA